MSASNNVPAQAHVLHVHLAPTLALRQSLTFPGPSVGGLAIGALTNVAPMTDITPVVAMSSATKILLASTPTDKALSQSEGSTIWTLRAGEVGEQIDDLLREGRVADAIGLVKAIGEAGLSPVGGRPELPQQYLTGAQDSTPHASSHSLRGPAVHPRPISTRDGHLSY